MSSYIERTARLTAKRQIKIYKSQYLFIFQAKNVKWRENEPELLLWRKQPDFHIIFLLDAKLLLWYPS